MKKTTVLLIDDDIDDQEIFEIAMQNHDADVECVFANNGPQALERLKADVDFVPDYIFLDINMPLMNGDKCLEELRKIDRLKDVPIYMYSTSTYSEKYQQMKLMGAAEYVVKPYSIKDLTAVLSTIVKRNTFSLLVCLCILSFFPAYVKAQDTLPPVRELKKLPIEELMNIMVTSVSRTPQNISEVASAVQVVTGQDIRRSAVTRLPEALRLVPNLQVAQSNSYDWGITARGFNGAPVVGGSLANKLLVMIDGRSVYTPLYGGVLWDVQDVLIEDIDRIEVVSGPGGVLWGANAVNGVINVLSKNTRETQGLYASVAAGSFMKDNVALRYGGKIGEKTYYKVYGNRYDFNNSLLINGDKARDNWERTQGGFRMDYTASEKNNITLQGDIYAGNSNDTLISDVNGLNVIGRWKHEFSTTSDFTLQTYIDQTYRKIASGFRQHLVTYDVDGDYRFSLGRRNKILMGAAFRYYVDDTESLTNTFTPEDQTLQLFSAFVQDEIEIVEDKLDLTLGMKLLHDTFSKWNYHPTLRIAWTPTDKHTIWSAFSQAVRVPSRFDVELTSFTRVDHPEYGAEKVSSYELGYRFHPVRTFNMSVTGFYNQYTDLRSLNTTENPAVTFVFGNNLEADTWGLEFSGRIILLTWWRIRGGYTYLQKEFRTTAANVFPDTEFVEAIDPNHKILLHSIMDLPKGFQLDVTGRFIDVLPPSPVAQLQGIPSYYNFNSRLAWSYRYVTLSVAGQNLVAKSHREFGTRNIPRSFYGKVTLRF
ncbi:MAG: TonB-dependent receptor plug domain-containing protein [Bacteroidia bacterium]